MTTRQAIETLGGALHRAMAFDAEATSVETGPAEAFAQRSGVCQDFAHVMIAGCARWGYRWAMSRVSCAPCRRRVNPGWRARMRCTPGFGPGPGR
ncbi:transglutaminase family protein [Novosphingobium sp. MW5]|nr:transglutaminase family protein [Novosphingobium sp. MW5]